MARRLQRSVVLDVLPGGNTWATALASAQLNSGRANILFVGDSYFEGVGATTRTNRWIDKLVAGLRTQYSVSGSGIGWISPYRQDSPSDAIYGATGTGSRDTNAQGTRGVLLDSGEYVQWSIIGDAIDVVHNTTSTAGVSVQISIDGGAPSSFSVSGGVSCGNRHYHSMGSNGSHTVRLTAMGGTISVDGIVAYAGDYNSGISFWECTRGSATSGTWLANTSASPPYWTSNAVAGWSGGDIHLIIDSLYGNDYLPTDGVNTPATVVSRFLARVQRYKQLPNNPDIVVLLYWGIPLFDGDNSTGNDHQDYRNALISAATSEGVYVINLYDTHGMADSSYLAADNVHPNNTGHQVIADAVRAGLAELL